ncbi:hypothetical protein BDV12DRAFT_187659 [Aspergillus spectabilis]
MASAASPIESLPNELLDEIISFLTSTPPSLARLHQPPADSIANSRNRDLKSLSLTCSRLLSLVRPQLFAHGCFELEHGNKYLSFISEMELGRYITSVVVKANDNFYGWEFGPRWWRDFLCSLRPLRLTLVAPPSVIGKLLGMEIPQEHIWAFEISQQVLQLECDWQKYMPTPESETDQQAGLLDCTPWSSMLFNESSSLKAYNHYEYFLYQVPSIFHRGGALASDRPEYENPRLSPSLANLTSFTYIAVFPFYNHVQLVLDAVEAMTNLQHLKIQLGPSQNDRATEIEQRGSMDPSDPWMELATGYSLIANAIRTLGRKTCLANFTAYDYEMEAVRADIDVILGDILCDGPWTHDGHGTWTKKPTDMADGQDNLLTTNNTAMDKRTPSHESISSISNEIRTEPTLAQTLLQTHSPLITPHAVEPASNPTNPPPNPNPSTQWNLKLDIEQGLHSPSSNVFSPGTVLGFSSLRGRVPDGNDDEFVGELPRCLLTKWLRDTPSPLPVQLSPRSTPRGAGKAFIIYPPNTTIFSPETLLASLLSHPPTLSRKEAIAYLDSVQLFPVFDFAAAVQAINEIGDSLNVETPVPSPTLLIITGLDTLTESVIRASNAVRGTAVLGSVLRSLTRLSRMHCSFLSVFLVNTSGVGPWFRECAHDQAQAQAQGQRDTEISSNIARKDGGSEIQSMFNVTDSPLFPTLLMRTLDQGIDTHLLISRTRGVPVIEVIKDRVGDGVGKWCVWERRKNR